MPEMTRRAFSRSRIMTMPPTVSPWPLSSATPMRGAPPSTMVATSPRRRGLPARELRRVSCFNSSGEWRRPRPRTMTSAEFTSKERPLASRLDLRTASATSARVTPEEESRSGSSWTWISRTKPPRGATSATPGTEARAGRRTQSCRVRSWPRFCFPEESARAYW